MKFDCVVCGLLCLDLPIRPIDQGVPLRDMETLYTDAIRPGGGGIVANSGMAMTRLGLKTAAMACVGNDVWADVLIRLLSDSAIDTGHVLRLDAGTSTTAVFVGEDGEHTFAFHRGASQKLVAATILEHLDLFAQSKFALFGYYALMPELEDDLAGVLRQVKETGCRTAMDASYGGGSMQPLDEILPHLDVYVPSLEEAESQTGKSEPREMVREFRRYAPDSLLGIKLGEQGAVLSPPDGSWIEVPPVQPPGSVIDTTGAGDCFYAGLIAALAKGMDIADAGRLAAAAGACSVTGIGAVEGLKDYESTKRLAGL